MSSRQCASTTNAMSELGHSRRPRWSRRHDRRAKQPVPTLPRLEPLEDRLLPSFALRPLADLVPSLANSSPSGFTDVNGTAFFAANDGMHGDELWESDGTAAGTFLVKDINPGVGGSHPVYLTNVNGTLFFQANDGTHGYELWESNGTTAGTFMVADINPGSPGSYPQYLTNVNGTLFFKANDGTHGTQLWESNGSAVGTSLVLDINGTVGSFSQNFTNVNGTVYSSAPLRTLTATNCGKAMALHPAQCWSKTSLPAQRAPIRCRSPTSTARSFSPQRTELTALNCGGATGRGRAR